MRLERALDAGDVEAGHREARVVDARHARAGSTSARGDEHQEVGAGPNAEQGRRRLVRLDVEAEQPPVELVRRFGIRHVDREMAEPGQRHRRPGRGGLGRFAAVAERPAAAAIGRMLELRDEPVGIGEEDLSRISPCHESDLTRAASLSDAMRSERFHHGADVLEAIHREPPVIEARSAGARGHERQEERPVAEAQQHLGPVTRLDRQPEELLVERGGARDVRNRERDLVDAAQTNRGRLGEQATRGREGRDGQEHLSTREPGHVYLLENFLTLRGIDSPVNTFPSGSAVTPSASVPSMKPISWKSLARAMTMPIRSW